MGLLFVAAIVSGAVLYAPYMRTLSFGSVRGGRSTRIRWLDLHNLLGITLIWALVVGRTGVMNELASPQFGLWQRTDIAARFAGAASASGSGNQEAPSPREFASLGAAWDSVRRALPECTVRGVDFPGALHGSPRHHLFWTFGNTPATARISTPVLVDARTGAIDAILPMPWYLRVVELSRPLHFGDYGGLPFKLLWTLLDVATILVLGSGLYLWISRRIRRGGRTMWRHFDKRSATPEPLAPSTPPSRPRA